MKKDHITSIISAVLILAFCYAAISKLADVRLFTAELDTHPFLRPFSGWLRWLIPGAEILICGLLCFFRTQSAGLIASLLLLTLFTGYLAIMLLTASDLPCSCGGIISGFSWKQHIAFNLLLAGISLWGFLRQRFLRARQKGGKPAISTL